MKLLKLYPENPNDKYIAMAVESLSRGNIIIYPTDTLYALGCDAFNNNAIEKICAIKSMKSDKTNLSIICESISQAAEYTRLDNETFRLMKDNLPGAFTFILQASNKLPKAFKGRKTVGIRIPDNAVAIALVKGLGHPIMTTSIPYSDEDTGSEPELIAQNYLNQVDLIIDSGRGSLEPSTIINCTDNDIIVVREGKGKLKE